MLNYYSSSRLGRRGLRLSMRKRPEGLRTMSQLVALPVSPFSLGLVTSAATAFETFFNPIGLPLSHRV